MPTDDEMDDARREAWIDAVLERWDRVEWLNPPSIIDHGGASLSDKRAG